MSGNSNNPAVRWRNHTASCIVVCLVLLCSVSNRAQAEQVGDAWPLYLIADTDNSSSTEDIIFGFDCGSQSCIKERMRLTDDGRLGLNMNPLSLLDVATDSYHYVVGANGDGTIFYDHPSTWTTYVRLGIPKQISFTYTDEHGGISTRQRSVYHGMQFVGGGSFYKHSTTNLLSPEEITTTVGLDLIGSDGREYYGPPNYDNNDGSSIHRALTFKFASFGPQYVSIAAGHDGSYTPVEALDVNGAIRIGNTSTNNAGTIRYNGGTFEGYNGTAWLNLGARTAVANNGIQLRDNEQVVFGVSDGTANNYIVNSLHAPATGVGFPIPAGDRSHHNYRRDDDGTSGGIAVVTDGDPHFTVKGNGNTYVHKRLSVGIGAHLPETALTVGGSVHIGPASMDPSTFDYSGRLGEYLLWVERGIVSEDFAIASTSNWSDRVFEEGYDLKPLADVESFIEEEGHLPGVPSARDVAADGYSVHDMTRILLEKVEELTLHAIAQQKAIDAQRDEIAGLRAQLAGGDGAGSAASYVKTGF